MAGHRPVKSKDLFEEQFQTEHRLHAPLADRIRPRNFTEFVGQRQVVGPASILRLAIASDELFSLIFWGPPGSGKTTLAKIIAGQTKSHFVQLSGVMSSKQDLLAAVHQAQEELKFHRRRTVLFIDEIHRWNKAQQDALLPYVEQGTVTLIGATTENPSFEVISALLSRCQVFVLERLQPDDIQRLIHRALADQERGYGNQKVILEDQAMELLAEAANGDARAALNTLEIAIKAAPVVDGMKKVGTALLVEAFQKPKLLYDKKGEEHYHIISAFIKSMRGSQPDAALYWLGRMVEAGEDPIFIARRMVVFASEDVGMADAQALPLAVACMHACSLVGLPECSINLSHIAVYLASCPKSNATYVAYNLAIEDVRQHLNAPVPLNLRNAPTKLMKDLGYHQGYKYAHDFPTPADADQPYLPEQLRGKKYYHPPQP